VILSFEDDMRFIGWVIAFLSVGCAAQSPLRLITSEDPDFAYSFRNVFPELSVNNDFSSWLKGVALVENRSDFPIYGYCIRWNTRGIVKLQQSKALPKAFTQPYFAEIISYPTDRSPVYVGIPVLLPHETQIVSPTFRWTSRQYSRDSVGSPPKNVAPFNNSALLNDIVAGRADPIPVVDSYIDAKLRMNGLDSAALSKKIYSLQRADREEAMLLSTEIMKGNTTEELTEKLRSEMTPDSGECLSSRGQVYCSEHRQMALRLSFALRTRGMAGVWELIRAVENSMPMDPGAGGVHN
jgi:hypothetical protein